MEVDDVLKKYSKKIETEMGSYNYEQSNSYTNPDSQEPNALSKDYLQFKEDMMPDHSRYEKLAKRLGGIIKLSAPSKDKVKIEKELRIAHLDLSSSEVISLAFMAFFLIFLFGIIICTVIFFITNQLPTLFFLMLLVTSLFAYYYFSTMPVRLATKWRLKASSQMVPAILYTVIYMKHTSNIERAIDFVSKHVEPPLALDFKKILWDVETGKFSSVKDSLENYLEFWRETNMEFVESFHLIESSLYEPNETRRIMILERSLKIILDGVYEKMLKYTHQIKSPLTNLYMLGIVLPTLGLALLPLGSTLLGGMIKAEHVFVLFNIIIPFFVFYMTLQVMLKRPGGYGETTLLERNPNYSQYVSNRPYYIAGLICFPFFFLGLLPLIFGYTPIPNWIGIPSDYSVPFFSAFGNGKFFGFINDANGNLTGPFGIGSILLSLFIPFSIAMFFSIAYSMKTKELIKSRDQTKELEDEFNSSLFTLGNRIGDGVPAEIAFSKVAESTRGQKTEEFFKIVNNNIQAMGMGLEEAIFNIRRGALVYFPSMLIATSMRILIESAKKGLNVAAQSLMSISEYVRNIQKINERLRDLLADVTSDMSSNMTFLAPLLAGIVIGLAAMITGILGQLKTLIGPLTAGAGSGIGDISGLVGLFEITKMISPYYLQIFIGTYIIEIIFILTSTLVTVDSGEDKLKTTYDIGRNLKSGALLYLAVALISILALAGLAAVALSGLGGATG